MWYAAFTLGLFGSIHCIGMCGPLAIAFCGPNQESISDKLISGVGYNLGRLITYSLLGLVFGLLGSFLFVADFQKVLSIILGALLVMSFLFSIDIDVKLNGLPVIKQLYSKLRIAIGGLYNQSQRYPPVVLGMANGLLPCGLVYLALTGALATSNVYEGMLFMALFGLGTFPMLLSIVIGFRIMNVNLRNRFRKVFPMVTLFFGLFLIYRGLMVGVPSELNFWEALKNPIMCH